MRSHSRNQSTNSSGLLPTFHRANAPSSRLSRTSTNNTNTNNTNDPFDNQSLRTIDQIPTTRPNITYLDKLWTQIDVLDDVKNMSEQVKEKGSFFNDEFNSDLNKLKQLQEKLMEMMVDEKFINTNNFKRQKEKYKSTIMDIESKDGGSKFAGSKLDSNQNRKKFKDFEKHDNSIYKKQDFDDINNYVNEVKINLDKVGESMKNFEDTTRDLW